METFTDRFNRIRDAIHAAGYTLFLEDEISLESHSQLVTVRIYAGYLDVKNAALAAIEMAGFVVKEATISDESATIIFEDSAPRRDYIVVANGRSLTAMIPLFDKMHLVASTDEHDHSGRTDCGLEFPIDGNGAYAVDVTAKFPVCPECFRRVRTL